MLKLENYIDGQLQPAIEGNTLDNFHPASGEVYGSIPNSNQADLDQAVAAAQQAFPKWSVMPSNKRFKILNRIAELIEQNRDELAAAESKDQGKPVWLAKNEMNRAAQNMRFFATACIHYASESHIMPEHAVNYTQRHPLGVVGCISPWNLPLYLFTWKIAPALATGNCVIAKPSEITPVTAYLFSKLCMEAGLPSGVLNILHGTGASIGAAMVEHPEVKAISFTGGTQTGKHIARVAAPMFKKLSLELGGKNPNLIFADADLDKAVETTVNSSFMNQGEICLCGSRIYVERSIYEDFKKAFVPKIQALKVGNPSDEDTRVGAIVSQPHYEKILSYIDLAKKEGANILAGGEVAEVEGQSGWFIQPTILEGLAPDSACNMEEIFGPVVTLTPFDTEEEAIALANSTQYGLACTLWTQNLQRAHRVAAKIQSGIIWINCWLLRDLRTPFGGMKDSGVGREGGFNAMNFFTEQQNVCIKL